MKSHIAMGPSIPWLDVVCSAVISARMIRYLYSSRTVAVQ